MSFMFVVFDWFKKRQPCFAISVKQEISEGKETINQGKPLALNLVP